MRLVTKTHGRAPNPLFSDTKLSLCQTFLLYNMLLAMLYYTCTYSLFYNEQTQKMCQANIVLN